MYMIRTVLRQKSIDRGEGADRVHYWRLPDCVPVESSRIAAVGHSLRMLQVHASCGSGPLKRAAAAVGMTSRVGGAIAATIRFSSSSVYCRMKHQSEDCSSLF